MKISRILKAVHNYIIFFLVVAFIVTCCTMLFVSTMAKSMGVTFTDDNIGQAAKATLLNVLLLTLLLTVCDRIRRKMTIVRPANMITEAAQKMMQGDFSVRIPEIKTWDIEGRFNEIAGCFNKMAMELSSIETLRTDFVANVSHELKTPLTVMQNYGTLLQNPDLPEEKRMEYAKAIADASRRLADLITNILRLSKLENQQITPQFAQYDLSEQLRQCLLGFEDVWEKKEIQIETDIEDGVTVKTDPQMLELVWNNLFSNAFKFTAPGGTVGLSVKSNERYAVVRISDTGCGISPEVGKRMFDKFYQGDTSHAMQGNGLGLALVKHVIDLTGSEISVESAVGKGSIFIVKLRRNTQ